MSQSNTKVSSWAGLGLGRDEKRAAQLAFWAIPLCESPSDLICLMPFFLYFIERIYLSCNKIVPMKLIWQFLGFNSNHVQIGCLRALET